MINQKFFLVALLFITLIVSCSKQQILKRYYLLDLPPASQTVHPDSTHFNPLPHRLFIEPFIIAGAYNSNRVALRTNSNELKYYYYHYWAQNPATAIRYFVFKQIKKSNLFTNCSLHDEQLEPDLLLKGRIDAIEREDFAGRAFSHLSISLELYNLKNHTLLVRYVFDRRNPLREDSPMNTFALQISRILHTETARFLQQIHSKL